MNLGERLPYDLKEHIEEIKVNCISFESLKKKVGTLLKILFYTFTTPMLFVK